MDTFRSFSHNCLNLLTMSALKYIFLTQDGTRVGIFTTVRYSLSNGQIGALGHVRKEAIAKGEGQLHVCDAHGKITQCKFEPVTRHSI